MDFIRLLFSGAKARLFLALVAAALVFLIWLPVALKYYFSFAIEGAGLPKAGTA